MAEVIKMPRLSDTMEEGVVAQWLKKVGDKVSEGDILAEIETDKATMEFESFYDGTLLHIAIDEGVAANVDSLLCIIGEEGEDISSLISTDSNVIEETSNSQLDLVDQINKQEQINEEVISNKETEESVLSDSENDIQNETLEINLLVIIAIVLSFLFSYITVKFFLNYLNKFSLNIFVIYRLIIALILLSIIYF